MNWKQAMDWLKSVGYNFGMAMAMLRGAKCGKPACLSTGRLYWRSDEVFEVMAD